MDRCATNRSLAKYFWLGLITLGIYDIVVMVRLGKDLNRIKEKLGIPGKKLMHYFGCMVLSIITLGIPLFIWEIRMPIRTYLYADKAGVEKKGSVALYFIFTILLVWTLVCPLIAISKLLKTANNVCAWYNGQLESEAAPKEVEAKEEPKAIESKEEAKVAEEPAKKEEKPAPAPKKEEAPKAEEKVEAKPAEEKKEAKPAEKKPAEKKAEPAKKEEKPAKKPAAGAAYHLSKRAEDNKWQVFIAGSDKVIKLFDTKAEAEEWVKEKAESTGRTVLVHASKGKNKGRIQ